MTKPAVLPLVLFAVFGTVWGDAAPAPFSLAVVPSTSFGDSGNISMSHDKPDDFYVVLTNVSGEPQVIWELRNSWGYQTISFDVTTANGKTFVFSRGPEEFTKNNPTTFAFQPGEHQVYAVHLDKWWVSNPAFPKADETPITLKLTTSRYALLTVGVIPDPRAVVQHPDMTQSRGLAVRDCQKHSGADKTD